MGLHNLEAVTLFVRLVEYACAMPDQTETPTARRDRAELHRHTVELRKVESELAALNRRAEYLRALVSAYRGLVALAEGEEPPPPPRRTAVTGRFVTRDDGSEAGIIRADARVAEAHMAEAKAAHDAASARRAAVEAAAAGVRAEAPEPPAPAPQPDADRPRETMLAKDAVRRVLGESQQAWKVTPLAREIERRGIVINSKNPVSAVRTATSRMVKSGEVVRLVDGRYVLESVADRVAALPLEGGDDEE